MIEQVARAIFEAKKEDCWGNIQSEYRKEWPKTPKELRTRLHHNEPALEFAFLQAKAAIEAMRKPTQQMMDEIEIIETYPYALWVWNKFIDAALEKE